jgi:hypothetical protein
MLGLLGLGALVLACFGFGFGATRLLLRGTALEDYTFEASLLLGPVFLVLTLSCGGYVAPELLSRPEVGLVVGAGLVLSAVVAMRDRRALGALLRDNGRRLLLVVAGGAWAMTVLVLYYPGNVWTTFFFLGNGEYINYAELAARLAGLCPSAADDPTPAFIETHRHIRYGQDILTGVVALLSGRHPITVVEPLSIFFRFHYAVALGLVLYRLAAGRTWLVAFLLFLDGYLLVETFSFTTSFLSSNCSLALYVVYLALIVGTPDALNGRAIILLLLANVYFLITYPELLPPVKLLELMLVAVGLVRRQRARWWPLVVGNVATLVLHPVLVFQKIQIAYQQMMGKSGWNIFGNPRQEPWTYVGNWLGLRYAHVPEDAFAGRPGVATFVIVVVGAIMIAGLLVLAVRKRLALAVGFWLALALLLHALPLVREGRHFYPALKFLTQSFFVPLAGIAALGGLRSRVVRGWVWGSATAWAAAAGLATIIAFAAVFGHGVAHDYPRLCRALAACGAGRPGVVGLVPAQRLFLLYFAGKQCGVPLRPLSGGQFARLQRLRRAPRPDMAVPPEDTGEFEGLVLVASRAESDAASAPEGVKLLSVGSGRQLILLADGRAVRFQPRQLLMSLGGDDLYLGQLTYLPELTAYLTGGTLGAAPLYP